MIYTVWAKEEISRAIGDGIRYSIQLKNDNPNDDAWISKVFVSKDIYDRVAIGKRFEICFFDINKSDDEILSANAHA